MIRAAIFDLDGTLVETENLNARAYAMVFQQLMGNRTPYHELLDFMGQQAGLTDATICQLLTRHFNLEASLRQLRPGREPWQTLLDRRNQAYDALISDPHALEQSRRGPVVSLLHQLRNTGMHTAVATSSLTREAVKVLGGMRLLDHLDQVVGFDQVSRPKPDPEIYLLTARRLGVSPGECLVLEDSPVGVQAGVAAGMKVVSVPNHVTVEGLRGQDFLDQQWVVYDLARLPAVVERRIAHKTTDDGR